MKAAVVLEDGKIFEGKLFGDIRRKCVSGEVVFNTSISGYQEIITDPSYRGQIVTMTYPLIGNYGINTEDAESNRAHVEGLIIRELCDVPSNYRATDSLDGYFKKNGILGITGVDTRALTRHIRLSGSMKGVITGDISSLETIGGEARKVPDISGRDIVKEVTSKERSVWNDRGHLHISVLDCGVKYNILRNLSERGCRLTVLPAKTGSREILELDPDGVLLSNGPGDPEGAGYVHRTVRGILGKVPIFGICLGHQMMGLALGGKTYKLKFGHHGGNHPVKDLKTGRVSITSQNHCFCVDHDSLSGKGAEITHMNLNDNTVEGMENEELKFFSVQFHPEAGPGPYDAEYLFDKFVQMAGDHKK
ncbi:MAG: glutamine-hydrolyzing carbamoyl-phosphate synthase small subunit [Candidatus Omnitrophota bacterium]